MSKKNYEISKQMNKDLIKAYTQVCGDCWTQAQAFERMVEQPAPRYYVTPRQAAQVIARMVRGDFSNVDAMVTNRREMWYSLFEVVKRLSEQREFIGKSITYIMNFAVLQPAPRFFIGPTRARIIRGFLRNGTLDKDGKVLYEKLPSYYRTREAYRKKAKLKKQWMLEKMSEEAGAPSL